MGLIFKDDLHDPIAETAETLFELACPKSSFASPLPTVRTITAR
ncbi:hypothetical protein [Reyranella sp.]